MEAHAAADELGPPVGADLDWAPQNPPAPDQHAKGALDAHPIGTLNKVKVSPPWFVHWDNHLIAGNVGAVTNDEITRVQLTISNSHPEPRQGPGLRVMRRRCHIDIPEEKPAIRIAHRSRKQGKFVLSGDKKGARVGYPYSWADGLEVAPVHSTNLAFPPFKARLRAKLALKLGELERVTKWKLNYKCTVDGINDAPDRAVHLRQANVVDDGKIKCHPPSQKTKRDRKACFGQDWRT